MNKFLVEVIVPTAGISLEIYIPSDMKIYEIIALMAAAVEKQTHHVFRAAKDNVLCDFKSGKMLDINKYVYQTEIENGTRLVLI